MSVVRGYEAGNRVLYKNRRRSFSCILSYKHCIETDNHFEGNAASATDKENDMRHIYCVHA